MIILGIGGLLGDAASAILKDGKLVAAVEELEADRPQCTVGTARRVAGTLDRGLPLTGRHSARTGGRGGRRTSGIEGPSGAVSSAATVRF